MDLVQREQTKNNNHIMELALENKAKTMTIHSREDVIKATVEYFNGDELAANVWVNKYALKDSDGNLYELTPLDMHKRIASELYRIEKSKFKNPMSYDEIYSCLKDFNYV